MAAFRHVRDELRRRTDRVFFLTDAWSLSGDANSAGLQPQVIVQHIFGGGGNRTRVRKEIGENIYACVRSFESRPSGLRPTGFRQDQPHLVSPRY